MGFTIFIGKHRWKRNKCLTCKTGADIAYTKPAHPQAEEDPGQLRLFNHQAVTQSLRRKAVDTHMLTARNASPDTDRHLKTQDSKSHLTNLRRCTVWRSFCLRSKVVWESTQNSTLTTTGERSPLPSLARSLSVLVSITIQLRFQKRHGSNVNTQPKLARGSGQ